MRNAWRVWCSLSVAAALCAAAPAGAVTIIVSPGESVQAAIDAATPGDRIEVQPGTYVENIDFGGKDVSVVGSGPDTVLQGTGVGSVVTFQGGETAAAVLDSMVVQGGSAAQGGGIYIFQASPTVVRNIVYDNRASQRGSGIHVEQAAPMIQNNLIVYNQTSSGDPHSIEVVDADPTISNNTILRNDSNGVILRGNTTAAVKNNLIGRNGSRGRGRGICDFSPGTTEISYGLFWRNRKAALLTGGKDFGKIRKAQLFLGPPRLVGNVDGNPKLFMRRPPAIGSKKAGALTVAEMAASFRPNPAARRRRAIDAGDPDLAYDDRDGSRNDIGFTGGPESPLW